MRSMYKAVLAAFAVALALGAVGVSSALAAPEWYSSATLPTAEWQQGAAKLPEAVATKWNGGVIKIADTTKVIGAVECKSSSGEGTAGPGSVGVQKTWTFSECALLKTGECETLKKVEAVDLPWHNEVKISKRGLVDVLSEDGKGKPGFKIECKGPLGVVADTCTAQSTLTTTLSNGVTGVYSTFGSEKLKCSVGGAEKGTIEGTQVIEATKGSALEANVIEGTYTKLKSALTVKGTGELGVETKEGIGETCKEVETEGTLKEGGKGTITSIHLPSGCAPTRLCSSVRDEEAVGLPWNTDLYESEGSIRDRIEIGGGGYYPQWRFECDVNGGGYVPKLCSLEVSPEIYDGLEGDVFAVFGEKLTKTTCSGEAGAWKGELKLAPTSGVIKAKK